MKKANESKAINVYEFIGSQIQVTESGHERYRDVEGEVVDETKKTFVIRDGKEKIIPKEGNTFEVKINERWYTLDGSKIKYRPEDRIKRLG